jgi:hypothetical protein
VILTLKSHINLAFSLSINVLSQSDLPPTAHDATNSRSPPQLSAILSSRDLPYQT